MTFRKFIVYVLLLWVGLGLAKALYFNYLEPAAPVTIAAYGLFIVLYSTAMVRRLGVINYLEGMLVSGVWFVIVFILDFIVLAPLLGVSIYRNWELWVGYVVMMLTVFLFHKKRHIAIRRELVAHDAHHQKDKEKQHAHKQHGDHHQQPHGQHQPGKH